ncbi:hypothetical protein ACQRBN_12315 [Bariatricus sp. SGI.154]|uniref:hypothetical protein n=1 Tax=Bariatricus sp. SGI.154 TaxID=3420549 RepID=UPI003CFD1FD1
MSTHQIPYNMEMDIDRLCLERAIHRFMRSGVAQDAFDVYFCYLEMFFGNYGKAKKMIEMLAEFESNASALLMKHRDHYSHSVYVFILGLAIYNKNEIIRKAYREYYRIADEKEAAHHYIRYWGLAALFHDIGYPFELPFEQVKSYYGNSIIGVPFVAYRGVQDYIRLSEEEAAYYEKLLGRQLSEKTVNAVLAVNIADKLESVYGCSSETICSEMLNPKPEEPDAFGGFMDHAYFSGVLLFKELEKMMGMESMTVTCLDALTAIVLHNSMYKFSVTNIRDEKRNIPFDVNLHPLAYILMLCDELQCWDRTSYGQNSRRELHAMWCDLEFIGNDIKAMYYYDSKLEYKKDVAKGTYRKMTGDPVSFVKDIETIIRVNERDSIGFSLDTAFVPNNRRTHTYLSNSSFIHLYNFAVALNGRYQSAVPEDIKEREESAESLEESFENLSLEYKLSNIMQAKAFAGYLDAIDCFYTDKPVDYELLDQFTDTDMDIIGPMEHERWLNEKLSMGWTYGTDYRKEELCKGIYGLGEDVKTISRNLREQTRMHELMVENYEELEREEQDKDTEPMNCMLHLIDEYDGLRIYRVN